MEASRKELRAVAVNLAAELSLARDYLAGERPHAERDQVLEEIDVALAEWERVRDGEAEAEAEAA